MTNSEKVKKCLAIFLIAILSFIGAIPCLLASAETRSNTITLAAYSYYKDDDGLGHSWIAITNDTNNGYNLGVYYMEPGETVTVGLWGNLNNNGVWYNLESYGIDEFGLFNGRVSIEMTINENQLATINSYIARHDYWNVSYNCSCFVKDIWNLVSEDKLNSGYLVNLPSWLCDSIKDKTSYFTNRYIPTNSKIGYADSDVFHLYTPSSLTGSSQRASVNGVEYDMLKTSFPEMTMQQAIVEQLDYNGINCTYEEYMNYINLH